MIYALKSAGMSEFCEDPMSFEMMILRLELAADRCEIEGFDATAQSMRDVVKDMRKQMEIEWPNARRNN